MTAVLVTTISRYIGLSTDTKPSPAAGSTFFETDTGNVYVYDGTAWQLGPEGSGWRLARGNWNFTADGGAQGAFTVAAVTGDVLVAIFAICNVALTSGGAATIEVGVAGNTAVLIAQATASAIVANEIWKDATPTTTVEPIDLDAMTFGIANGQDIIQTIGTADLTAGDLDYYIFWKPLSANGLVAAA